MKKIKSTTISLLLIAMIIACTRISSDPKEPGLELSIQHCKSGYGGDYTELMNFPDPILGGSYLGLVFDVTIKNNCNHSDTLKSWEFIEDPAESAAYRVNYLDSINRFCTMNKQTIYPPIILYPNETLSLKMIHCVEVDEHVITAINHSFENQRHLDWPEISFFIESYFINKIISREYDECLVPFRINIVTKDSLYEFPFDPVKKSQSTNN